MSELEEAGLLEQPHTSAGRVPTDKGYRYYVDNMLAETRLSRADLRTIDAVFAPGNARGGGSPERLMERASHALSELSDNVGIVLSPSLAENRLNHIEFLKLSTSGPVVLVTSRASVHNKIIRIADNLTQMNWRKTARYLNTEFSGKPLEIRADFGINERGEGALRSPARNAVLLCDQSLEGDAGMGDVYFDGASTMLTKPDFVDVERMRDLFRTFEEKSRLVKILNECLSREQSFHGDISIVIGREHPTSSMQNCALITAPYRVGLNENVGTLGVVGPMRIEYSRIMAMVNYMARLIERRLSEENSLY